VDQHLKEDASLHCIGGFVLTIRHGLERGTGDLDYIGIVPIRAQQSLEQIAGRGSALAAKYGLYVQSVTTDLPDGYEERLTELCPGVFKHLRLFALDPHDLALSKLTRNHPVDRADVAHLAKTVPLEANTLVERYRQELRPIITGDAEKHDLTLQMWIEAYFPTRP
jgi:hypothetical protein